MVAEKQRLFCAETKLHGRRSTVRSTAVLHVLKKKLRQNSKNIRQKVCFSVLLRSFPGVHSGNAGEERR
jgi:hypothetical protein